MFRAKRLAPQVALRDAQRLSCPAVELLKIVHLGLAAYDPADLDLGHRVIRALAVLSVSPPSRLRRTSCAEIPR
jgi:hypothetical protein